MAGSKALAREIATQRITILFHQATLAAAKEPELSRSYVRLLRRISAHYKVKLGSRIRNSICSRCNTMLVPGLTATVTLASSKSFAAYRCMNCGAERHLFYRRRQSRQ